MDLVGLARLAVEQILPIVAAAAGKVVASGIKDLYAIIKGKLSATPETAGVVEAFEQDAADNQSQFAAALSSLMSDDVEFAKTVAMALGDAGHNEARALVNRIEVNDQGKVVIAGYVQTLNM